MRFNESFEHFFEMLPVPLLLIKANSDSLNHTIEYINPSFTRVLGWKVEEIPDKNTWWLKAYPDENYQKVVMRQWELAVETSQEEQCAHISLEVNVQTKLRGERRFRVTAEAAHTLLEGYYIVMFEEVKAKHY